MRQPRAAFPRAFRCADLVYRESKYGTHRRCRLRVMGGQSDSVTGTSEVTTDVTRRRVATPASGHEETRCLSRFASPLDGFTWRGNNKSNHRPTLIALLPVALRPRARTR